jgi:hypothetical protein
MFVDIDFSVKNGSDKIERDTLTYTKFQLASGELVDAAQAVRKCMPKWGGLRHTELPPPPLSF